MNWLPIIIIGGALAYKYLPTGLALIKLDFSFVTFEIVKIEPDKITAGIILKVKNNSSTSIIFQQIKANLFLNGKKIGWINNNFNMPLKGNGAEMIKIVFTLEKGILGSELWNMIQTKQTDFTFNMNGTVRANDTTFPLNSTFTMNDLADKVNPPISKPQILPPAPIDKPGIIEHPEPLEPPYDPPYNRELIEPIEDI